MRSCKENIKSCMYFKKKKKAGSKIKPYWTAFLNLTFAAIKQMNQDKKSPKIIKKSLSILFKIQYVLVLSHFQKYSYLYLAVKQALIRCLPKIHKLCDLSSPNNRPTKSDEVTRQQQSWKCQIFLPKIWTIPLPPDILTNGPSTPPPPPPLGLSIYLFSCYGFK